MNSILRSRHLRRPFLWLLAPLTAALSIPPPAAAADRPNVLFIFSDDHAPNAISSYPGGILDRVAPTPSIDRIAKEGVLFVNSYCTNSICGPSRASILTGKHSHLNGFLDNNSSYFDGRQQTFPPLLQAAGYQTAMIGKWHLHSNPVGFDHWEILPGQGSYYNPDFIQMDGSRKRYTGYCTDLITDFALDWLKGGRDEEKPFMLMVQHKAPHRNWSPPERHLRLFDDVEMPEPASLFDDYADRSTVLAEHAMGIDKHMYWGHDMKFHGENQFPEHFSTGIPNGEYRRMNPEQKEKWDAAYGPKNARLIAALEAGEMEKKAIVRWKYQRYIKDYLRCIRAVDEGIGRLLAHLDETGLAENTVVIYASDQGFYLGEHGWYDKRWMFEESFKMPFVVRWPGKMPAGRTSTALIQNIDYAPTFLQLAGAEVPADMQGESLLPLFRSGGEKPAGWRDALYYAYYGERTHNVAAHFGVHTGKHKLFWVPKTEEWQLFDLEKDPAEMRSVHADPAYAGTLKDLQRRYDELRKKYRAHSALLPAHRNAQGWWQKRQAAKNQLARKERHELLFIGDSITQGWEGAGKAVWEKHYAGRKALNLGFSGDRTEHVIWRLNNGNLRNQRRAKVAVVMIGTNNTGHSEQDPSETAEGVDRILSTLRARCPETKVLLLAVFPRGAGPDDKKRRINDGINQRLQKLADGERVHYLDIGSTFLGDDGRLPKEIMPDRLHLSPEGYARWAAAIEEKLCQLGGWEPVGG